MRTPAARSIGDHVLRPVRIPVPVLLAGNMVRDPAKGIARPTSAVPHWHYHLRPNASHALPIERPDDVNGFIRRFVIQHHPRTA